MCRSRYRDRFPVWNNYFYLSFRIATTTVGDWPLSVEVCFGWVGGGAVGRAGVAAWWAGVVPVGLGV
jgi:hypothetical protein